MESKKCVEIVEHLLEFVPKCRDNDLELIQEVWRRQSGFMYELDKQPIAILFGLMDKKVLSHPSTIKRTRAKLQELYYKYRGEKYYVRKGIAQENAKAFLEHMDAESTSPNYDLVGEVKSALGFGGSNENK